MARTRAEDYDEKRRQILKTSAGLFARHGFTGTSITMVAQACGASKALLYHYYASKEEVLFDILHLHLETLVETVERAFASTAEPEARLHALSAALLETYRDADAEHQIQIANLQLLPPERQEVLRELERRIVAVFAEAIAAAVPSAAPQRHLLKPLTMSLFGMLNWSYLWFRDGRGLSREDYARLATDLILRGAAPAMAGLEAETASNS
ncbi:TetR/AcrR family transcriptional regulator [Roseomonas marmotae]|uniref:TetR family transcriptional regulator n=1 Tax=Roseomonas marmotae TaxID=2768161 RepID=A0ABS3K9G7_9PROT|nr:TetR/AcrR family transcriptional regulator [Roseomonas marmotae]MBO1074092.1 TetR family transcriptional regulator [Roseomonas marmotae]QTI78875.1 TetR family transcriptional regulator [Roseomonas marmotae]